MRLSPQKRASKSPLNMFPPGSLTMIVRLIGAKTQLFCAFYIVKSIT
jgi:hypothetical protein